MSACPPRRSSSGKEIDRAPALERTVMKTHTPVIELARRRKDYALLLMVEAGTPQDHLKSLMVLAKKAIYGNPNLELFSFFYGMVLAACEEVELGGTECLIEDNGYIRINENPGSEDGKSHLKNCRRLQKNMTDDLLRATFDANISVDPMLEIQKLLMKWLLEKALLSPTGDDCLYVFGHHIFGQLEPVEEQVIIDAVREVTMLPDCKEKEIRGMLLYFCGGNANLRGKFAERVRRTLAVSWQHKLTLSDSLNLVGIFHSIAGC